jgi:hypothetical protein
MNAAPTDRPTKAERRERRYKRLWLTHAAIGLCNGEVWRLRWRLVKRFGYGPKALRGKSLHQLFEMLYDHD